MLEQRPQVILHLGSHRDSRIAYAQELEAEVRDQLSQSPTSRVIYFAEGADVSEGKSERISKLVRKGILPSVAAGEVFGGNLGPSIRLYNERGIGDFTVAGYSMADRMHSEFPGRFGFAIEHVSGQAMQFLDVHDQLVAQVSNKFLSGQFDGALQDYKKLIAALVANTKERDKAAAKKIQGIVDGGNTVVVARFGAAHSDIYHHLRNKGTVAQRKFDDIPFHFDPTAVLVRSLIRFPGRQFTDEQLTKFMLGQMFAEVIKQEVDKGKRKPISGSEIAREAFATVHEDYNTPEKIRDFEMMLKQAPLSK